MVFFNKKYKIFKISLNRIIIFLLFSGLILFYPGIIFFNKYLSKTEKVKANILLVEGWMPPYALRMAAEEFQKGNYDYLITSGISLPGHLEMFMNGYLVYSFKNSQKTSNTKDTTFLEMEAFASLGGKNKAHFNLWINDSLISDYWVGKQVQVFSANIPMSFSEIDSIMIQFDNDGICNSGDINLFFKDLRIDGKSFSPYSENNYYDIEKLDGRHKRITNARSYAESAKQTLINYGIDGSRILSVPGKSTQINRTLESSLAFSDWLKTSDLDVEGLNIVSLGAHSRRTWETYKSVLNHSLPIGIIALKDRSHHLPRRYAIKFIIKQSLAYYYYRILILPFD